MHAWVAVVVMTGCVVTPAVQPPAPRALAQLEASRDLDGIVVGPSDAPTIVIVFASWCTHCRDELGELAGVRRPVRLIGVNYRGHEEYDHRGNSDAVRAFAHAWPWLRVVPIGDDVFGALGRPPLIPVIYIYDRRGGLVATFDRRERAPPSKAELDAILTGL